MGAEEATPGAENDAEKRALRDLVFGHPSSDGVQMDNSLPLTTADLHTCLARIRIHSDDIKEKVYKTVTAHHADFARMISHVCDANADVAALESDVATALANLDESSADSADSEARAEESRQASILERIESLVSRKRQLEASHELNRIATQALRAVVDYQSRLSLAERHLAERRLVRAAQVLKEAQKHLPPSEAGAGGGQPGGELQVLAALRNETASRQEGLRAALERAAAQHVVLDGNKRELRVAKSLPGGAPRDDDPTARGAAAAPVHLSEVLEAMEVMGMLPAWLSSFADRLFLVLLEPILTDAKFKVEEDSVAASRQVARLLFSSTARSANAVAPVPGVVYPKLLAVVHFLRHNLSDADGRLMHQLAHILWPRLANAIVGRCLGKAVPSRTAELAQFQAVADTSIAFEDALLAESFVPEDAEVPAGSAEGGGRARWRLLSAYAANVDVHFALKRREAVLIRARELILQRNDATCQVGDDRATAAVPGGSIDSDADEDDTPLFVLEQCHVSTSAPALLALVHDTFKEACLSTTRTAQELFSAAREALALYRAIVPVQLGAQREDDPGATAVLHNDCTFLAHHLLLLLLQYRASLPVPVRQVAQMADLVPVFRRLAGATLERQLAVHRLRLLNAMKGVDGFSELSKLGKDEEARRALQQAVRHLAHLGSKWRPIMGRQVYNRTLASLAELVTSRVAFLVLELRDISVQETVQLQSLLSELTSNLPHLFRTAPPSAQAPPPSVTETTALYQLAHSEGEESNPPSLLPEADLMELIPSYKKLRRLIDLLDMSLLAITQAAESGDLARSGFSAREVLKFVNAVFSETPLRTDCLKRIAAVDS